MVVGITLNSDQYYIFSTCDNFKSFESKKTKGSFYLTPFCNFMKQLQTINSANFI